MLSNYHLHSRTGRLDFHFLIMRRFLRSERSRLTLLKAVTKMENKINDARRQEGRPLLPTGKAIRAQKRKFLGIKSLAEQLARFGPLQVDKLEGRLTQLGHSLASPGIVPEKNRVHVIHAGKKRSFGYRLDTLETDVLHGVAELLKDKASPPETSFDLPDDSGPDI